MGSQSEDDESWEALRELDLSRAPAPAAVVATSHSPTRAWWDQLRELGSHFLPAPAAMQPLPLPAAAVVFLLWPLRLGIVLCVWHTEGFSFPGVEW